MSQPSAKVPQTDREASAVSQFLAIVQRNRRSQDAGVYAVCSAHPAVIEAAIQQALEDGSLLEVESTSSQVNHFGGYTGQNPDQFAAFVHDLARRAGLPPQRVLLGGDHLGPFPWKNEPSASAMEKGCDLVRACVHAGYKKIHLDASMACADDGKSVDERTIADRACLLCQAAEHAYRELPVGSAQLVYVIGTEVPAPGGEVAAGQPPATTRPEDAQRTLEVFRTAFANRGLTAAWNRVIGLVVQPGVEFGEDVIFDYDGRKAGSLSAALPSHPALVYEAHSTDYQRPTALAQMVEDHFAILKVGPWLTFAYREAIFALSSIERELLAGTRGVRPPQVREALDAAMLRNPVYWRSYYRGSEEESRVSRAYSYSDRCRYYWHEPVVQQEVQGLLETLAGRPIPLPLISQYMPLQYDAIRDGTLKPEAAAMIQDHIRRVLRVYAAACGYRGMIDDK